MRFLNLKEQCLKLNDPETLNLIQSIELNRGKNFSMPKKLKINRLHDLNKRRSVTSSNRIEGIEIAKDREIPVLLDRASAETKEEYLLDGYNKALDMIFQVYPYQSLSESFIKDLHYKLYEGFAPEFGGRYKTEQNYIREYDSKGNLLRTVFIPVKPSDVADYMGNLIYQFNVLVADPMINKLILVSVFLLDFLCIHPFFDGNGRISRLLTASLLLKYGYEVDSYYSTSYVILNSASDYYKALEKSSAGWHESENDYSFFTHYMLHVLSEAYRSLSYIAEVNSMKGTCTDKVLKVINDSIVPIAKSDIEETLVNYTRTSIELALSQLTKSGKIMMIQKGRFSKYFRK